MNLEERSSVVRSIGEEWIQEEELRNLLAKKPNPIYYFEPSRRMHIAQVSYFGLARLAMDAVTLVTTHVMGIFGYLAPEYASSGKLTEKSDVYSFCVVPLELIIGRKHVDTSQPMGMRVSLNGVTSHTDVALLAETFAEANCSTKVVGVPVTFYGDLKNQFVEANVGCDTVGKVVGVPETFYGDLKNQFIEANVGCDTVCKVLQMSVG